MVAENGRASSDWRVVTGDGPVAFCAQCERPFRPTRKGHLYCSTACRHLGPRQPFQAPADLEAVARLFDESRDPGAHVRPDDWFPAGDPGAVELYLCDRVADRRRWYLELARSGRV